MWRQAKGGFEGPGQAEAINCAGLRQVIQPDVFTGIGMQVITGNLGDQWQAWVPILTFSPIKVTGERVQQGVDPALTHNA